MSHDYQAELVLPSQDLNADIAFLTDLGFRMERIYPSDDPAVAVMSGHGMQLRLDKNIETGPAIIHLLTDNPGELTPSATELVAPNGTTFRIKPRTFRLQEPETRHKFEVRKLQDSDPWVIGRAGMQYRDLIPDRLGGSIIASHIRIPEGGPVPDVVHYHTIGFQLIFCYKGWVKLVYEDQGEPFILKAGDCVTQPPEIRHRVLEASDQLEVIEIGVPAEHMTTIDHEMELPTATINREREFQGQRFCHHKANKAVWADWRLVGFEFRETGIVESTKGIASVHVAKSTGVNATPLSSHSCDILFTFVMEGRLELNAEGHEVRSLKAGDAFVIPPDMKYRLDGISSDTQLLEVALPGNFETTIY